MFQNTSLLYLAAKISFKTFNSFISPWAVVFLIAVYTYIQLFREKLSEKVHATILKGIVGGFVSPVLQRILK